MEMNYNVLLSSAISIAVVYHEYKINKDDTLYVLHPIRLMTKATTIQAQIVAVLHDVVEDTGLTLSDLARVFPQDIIDALVLLTRVDGQEYEDYIEKIANSGNKLALEVKLLDLYDNINITRLPTVADYDLKRAGKYHRAIKRLESVHIESL
jgi:GTP diphosphokinase / guanosine-3',5'-bis(diphosphate) 3'-diphosphatase